MKRRPKLNQEKLLEEVYNRGSELEQRYYGCAQCVVAALQDFFPVNDDLVKAATSFSGGFASTTEGPCGALTGGIMVLGYFFGRPREEFSDIAKLRRPGPLVRELWKLFHQTYSGDTCREVQVYHFGRVYHFLDGDEYQLYEEAGGHSRVCAGVVGQTGAWLAEILLQKGIPALKT